MSKLLQLLLHGIFAALGIGMVGAPVATSSPPASPSPKPSASTSASPTPSASTSANPTPSASGTPGGHMIVGVHSNSWKAANAKMGPLEAQRLFFPGKLPAKFAGSVADRYPDNVVLYISYKKPSNNTASFVRSIPANKKVRMIYHHEPENDYGGNGAKFVKEFEAQYKIVKHANPKIPMGMAAMTYQYASGRNGHSGSYLPPANSVDFYAADNYEKKINSKGLAGDQEFQDWYNLVKDRGKPLALTEYGVGATGKGTSGAQRAAVIKLDDKWLTSTGKFNAWLYWYSKGSGPSLNWAFTDSASINAWKSVAKEHNAG